MSEHRARDPFDPDDTVRIDEDVTALERFYRAHYEGLVQYLAGRVTDPHDVADLVADAFLTAMGSAKSFDPRRGRPMAWLIGIARNELRHFQRRRFHQQRAVERIAGRRLLDADDIADLEERMAAQPAGAHVMTALTRLPPAQRELVELVDLQGFTPAEAAAVCRIPAGLARIRLHRARTALRATLPERATPAPSAGQPT